MAETFLATRRLLLSQMESFDMNKAEVEVEEVPPV